MILSSTAATFCCLVAGAASGSGSRARLFERAVVGVVAAAAVTFHCAGGSAVPCIVWKEKQSKVLCPGLPQRQQLSRSFLWWSTSFWGTPCSAAPMCPHPLCERASFFLGSRFSSCLEGHFSFSRWLSRCQSSFLVSPLAGAGPARIASLAALRAFFFSTCIPAR